VAPSFGTLLRQAREVRGLSGSDAARSAGISAAYLSKLENDAVKKKQFLTRAQQRAFKEIREEIEVYNGLIPEPGELSATLFLEIEDQSHLRDDLLKFLGVDEAVFLTIGARKIQARFEEGRSKEDKISAVQYVKFPLTADERAAFTGPAEATLLIEHPNYQAQVRLDAATRKSLIADLSRTSDYLV
jgi:transcriptional regulator with XRE-family HTH domain